MNSSENTENVHSLVNLCLLPCVYTNLYSNLVQKVYDTKENLVENRVEIGCKLFIDLIKYV